MTTSQMILTGAALVAAAPAVIAQQQSRPLGPDGSSAAQVSGQWVKSTRQTYTAGGGQYTGGKWIDITFGRPLKRGRDLWGSGPTYGKDLLVDGATIWRAG